MSNELNNSALNGSCLCGSVQYSVSKIEKHLAHCHCTMCRKFHGSAFSTYGVACVDNFQWLKGEQQLQEYIAANKTKRLFCSKCGSSLAFVSTNSAGQYIEFALGTLDSNLESLPDAHIFTSTSVSWYQAVDELPQFLEGRDSSTKNREERINRVSLNE